MIGDPARARPRARRRWALLLPLLLVAAGAPACEVLSVSLAPTGAGSARLRITHDGGAGFRQHRDAARLLLFIEGCRTKPGAHRVEPVHAPVTALRWSYHAENDAVWVVVELPAAARAVVSADATSFEVALGDGTAAGSRRWPLGFRVVHPLPEGLRAAMSATWREGCPVPLGELSLVEITHNGFDGRQHQGDLVVHRELAAEVVAIFAELLAEGCPIERVHLVDRYGGDDEASMADNNTSAFNCRLATGSSGRYSVHSFGRAIDVNPVQNPYVRGDVVLPAAGREHLDREQPAPGRLLRGDACHRAFASRGWAWGGDWNTLRDYQHFEKP